MASNDSKLELFDPQSQNITTWMERFEMLMEIRNMLPGAEINSSRA
jgi:hypothetical protein